MMKNPVVSSVFAVLLFWVPAWPQSALKPVGFHAYLFNGKTGKLSPDVLAKGAPELGNVPSGKPASLSTLVVVEVELQPQHPVPDKAQVHLVGVENGAHRTLADKTSSLGGMNDKGIACVGFWLDNTGCRGLSLKAFISGSQAPPLTGVLPFTCYE